MSTTFFDLLLFRKSTPPPCWRGQSQLPPPAIEQTDHGEPERPDEPPFWTCFIENPRPKPPTD